MTNQLFNIALQHDPDALSYVKNEVVTVRFAEASGVLQSSVGANHYQASDAIIRGANGDEWSVSRERFDAKYLPLPPLQHGAEGSYRNKPSPVLAKRMANDFSIERSAGGDVLHGVAGDWLVQYAVGDYGIVDAKRFLLVYRPLQGHS